MAKKKILKEYSEKDEVFQKRIQDKLNEIKSFAFNLIDEKVNEIFLEIQDANNIDSGDIHPMRAFKLDEVEEELSEVIAETIVYDELYDSLYPESPEESLKESINVGESIDEFVTLCDKLYDKEARSKEYLKAIANEVDSQEELNEVLAQLWAMCILSEENPWGQGWDDEIYDGIASLKDERAIFDRAKEIFKERYTPIS